MKQEQITREKFNHLKRYYDETWDIDDHTLHVGVFKEETDSLETAYKRANEELKSKLSYVAPLTAGSCILDVGCGAGRTLVDLCNRHDCGGVGVDISDAQIADARRHLRAVNTVRRRAGKKSLAIKFIRCSASELRQNLRADEQFSHVISQDAILLEQNKAALFQDIYRLLIPGGVCAIADFLSERQETGEKKKKLLYELVNWTESLSQDMYREVLSQSGLVVTDEDRRDTDMIKTYVLLAERLRAITSVEDEVLQELRLRYEQIVESVKSGSMGWLLITATKPKRPVALLAGTKPNSIGRYLANKLHREGWDVWLYSRTAKILDDENWHERTCDITKPRQVRNLLSEVPIHINLVMMMADTGGGHGRLLDLSMKNIQGFVNAKLLGSMLLVKELLLRRRHSLQLSRIKMVWCAGNPGEKPEHLLTYGVVNNGLVSLVSELNRHYNSSLEAYYLPTTVISPSTLGDAYIDKEGESVRKLAQHPETIVEQVKQICEGSVSAGIIGDLSQIV